MKAVAYNNGADQIGTDAFLDQGITGIRNIERDLNAIKFFSINKFLAAEYEANSIIPIPTGDYYHWTVVGGNYPPTPA